MKRLAPSEHSLSPSAPSAFASAQPSPLRARGAVPVLPREDVWAPHSGSGLHGAVMADSSDLALGSSQRLEGSGGSSLTSQQLLLPCSALHGCMQACIYLDYAVHPNSFLSRESGVPSENEEVAVKPAARREQGRMASSGARQPSTSGDGNPTTRTVLPAGSALRKSLDPVAAGTQRPGLSGGYHHVP